MYADDTHLTFASNDVILLEENMNNELIKVSDWLIANKLTLSRFKTEFMLLGSRQRLSTLSGSLSLSINGNSIKQVEFTESLGVYIDKNLSWNLHITKISKMNSLVQPHFDYCSVVWGNCNNTLANKLHKLQNRAARILTSSSYDANADDLIARLGCNKLDVQQKFKTAVLVYKSLNGLAPDYLVF